MFSEVLKQMPLDLNPLNQYLCMDEGNIDIIKTRLFNLENLSDQEAYNLIYKTYPYILDEMFIAKNMDLIKFLYTNPRFIMNLGNVLSRTEIKLNYMQIVYCNKLAYDFFTARGHKDDYIRALLINLVKTVNRNVMPGLIGLGLSEETAAVLCNARYSSLKDSIQVKRLNLEICKASSDKMTVQMIVDIYGKLFDRITPLFTGIMYDCWSSDQFVNKDMEEVYGTINVALLEIVNNLPDDIMYQLLKNFSESHSLIHLNDRLRFNIYSFCREDYPRLYFTLERLNYEGISLPMK